MHSTALKIAQVIEKTWYYQNTVLIDNFVEILCHFK